MSTQQQAFDYNSDGISDLINTYTFDADGALIGIGIDYDTDGTSDISYTYTYDANGDLTSEKTSFSIFGETGSNPTTFDIAGNSVTAPLSYSVVTDSNFAGGDITTFINDANGQRASISVSYIDDGVIEDRVDISVTGANVSNFFSTRGAIQSFFYDENDRLVREISGFDDNPGVTITYAYDAFGNLASESYDYEPDGIVDDVFTYIPSANAVDDAVVTTEDSLLTGDVFADNGSGPDTSPSGGSLTVTELNGDSSDVASQVALPSGALLLLNSDGTFNYDPNGQFDALNSGESATDSFTYTADNGNGLSDMATVTVTIDGVGMSADAPVDLVGTRRGDILTGASNNDRLDGQRGRDQLFGLAGEDTLLGGSGSDVLDGGDDSDFLDGGRGKDQLLGGAGEDSLFGGSGNDLLNGGADNDELTGGGGKDTFVLAAGAGTDTITDFNRRDFIGLSLGISVSDLTFSGNDIILNSTNEVLANLTGVDTTTIRSDQFVSV